MKKILVLLAVLISGVFTTISVPTAVFADDNEMNHELCEKITDDQLKEAAGCNTTKRAESIAVNLIQAAIAVCGIVAVIVIVVSGQRFISANGDAARVSQAKNMLIYAIIGLIIAMLSFSVVTFVSRSIQNSANTDGGGGTSESGGGGDPVADRTDGPSGGGTLEAGTEPDAEMKGTPPNGSEVWLDEANR